MKKMLSLLLTLMLCTGWVCAAAADGQITATQVLTIHPDVTPGMQRTASLAIIKLNGSKYLFGTDGEQLTATGYIDYTYDYHKYKSTYTSCGVSLEDPINNWGVLNKQGELVTEEPYGHIQYFSEKWFAAVVLRDADPGINDYASSHGPVQIVRADIFFEGKKITTLERAEYGTAVAYGDYLYMSPDVTSTHNRGAYAVVTPDGEYIPAPYGAFEYETRFDDNYQEYYFHTGSQQKAFTPDCTLTNDEVYGCVLYDGRGNFFDLQGCRLFSSDLVKHCTGTRVLPLIQGRYVVLSALDGYYMFDSTTGSCIAHSSDFQGGTDNYMASGYQLIRSENETLCFIDAQGQLLLDTGLTKAETELANNAPFVVAKDAATGKYAVYTPHAGKLDTLYDGINYDGTSVSSRVLSMIRNQKYGVIDVYGNTVVDFVYDRLLVSIDGTMVVATHTDVWPYETHVYRIDYAAAAAEAARDAEQTTWHCDVCNRDNDMNFCPGCGAARPVKLLCTDCGYEPPVNDYLFCPNCGKKF